MQNLSLALSQKFRSAMWMGGALLVLLIQPSARAAEVVGKMVEWIAASGDNADMPFVIIDKRAARLHVFDARGRPVDSTAVLLGSAPGDDSSPGVGNKPLSQVLPEERTTPAGRFVGRRGSNLNGERIVWIDYEAAVSMHRVRAANPREGRVERLSSATIADNRISYGCVNIPVAFFDTHIEPTFATHQAVIYVLPEHKTLRAVFGAQAPEAVR